MRQMLLLMHGTNEALICISVKQIYIPKATILALGLDDNHHCQNFQIASDRRGLVTILTQRLRTYSPMTLVHSHYNLEQEPTEFDHVMSAVHIKPLTSEFIIYYGAFSIVQASICKYQPEPLALGLYAAIAEKSNQLRLPSGQNVIQISASSVLQHSSTDGCYDFLRLGFGTYGSSDALRNNTNSCIEMVRTQ
ncbi:hypothetical protein C8Q75DRAFT_730125 [Abortiporus biennis]|nr:hypothetical protein C8Q75DRAFT_730125 [Abortiporus biennis]